MKQDKKQVDAVAALDGKYEKEEDKTQVDAAAVNGEAGGEG